MKNNINGRRKFIKNSGLALGLLSLNENLLISGEYKRSSKVILKKLSIINDSKIKRLLPMQINKANSRWNGGVMDIYHVPNAHSTMNFIIKLSSSYASPYSKFYQSYPFCRCNYWGASLSIIFFSWQTIRR